MVTIEELLGASSDDIEKMSDEELKIYLKDIISLEPIALPKPLGSKEEDEDSEVVDSDNPIKGMRKKKKSIIKKLRENPLKALEELKNEIDNL